MSDGLITCRDCQRFRQGHGSPQAFGLCRARRPWDGYQGQWPDKQHPCPHHEPRPDAAKQEAQS